MAKVSPGEALRKAALQQARVQVFDSTILAVDHPQHYGGDVPHETVKCLAAWGLESDALLWNAAKYISRAGKKGEALEDLRKARWYLDRRIAALEHNG